MASSAEAAPGRATVSYTHLQLVDGVGRVGNEFTEEHFLVRVKGLGEKTEKLGDLGLKTMDFLCHF